MSDKLPRGWIGISLGEVTQPCRPRRLPKDCPKLPFVGMEQVESHSGQLLSTLPSTQMKSTAFHFQPGDVLYGRLRPYLNKVLCADFEGLCSSEFIVMPPTGLCEPAFLSHLLSTDRFVTFANGLNQGDRPRVSFDQVARYPVPLPPLNEQRRIVAKLEKILAKVNVCRRRLERIPVLLKRFRQSVLAAACSGRLTDDWREANNGVRPATDLISKQTYSTAVPVEQLDHLPPRWSWVALGNYGHCSRGRFSVRPRNDPRYFSGPYPFIQIGDLPREGGFIEKHSQTLNEKGRSVSKSFKKGTVVIAIVGATIGNTGVLSYDMCFTDSLVGIETGTEHGNRYVELYLQCQKHTIREASYSSGGQPNIKLEFLNPYPLALPPLPEQKEIVRRVDDLFAFSDQIEARYEKAKAHVDRLTQSVLAKAFRGELVPQDPNDEPASVLIERIRSTSKTARR